MLKAYQYRLYPTKAQVSTLNKTFDLCRKVYNNTLALKRDSWDYDQIVIYPDNDTLKELVQFGKKISRNQNSSLTGSTELPYESRPCRQSIFPDE